MRFPFNDKRGLQGVATFLHNTPRPPLVLRGGANASGIARRKPYRPAAEADRRERAPGRAAMRTPVSFAKPRKTLVCRGLLAGIAAQSAFIHVQYNLPMVFSPEFLRFISPNPDKLTRRRRRGNKDANYPVCAQKKAATGRPPMRRKTAQPAWLHDGHTPWNSTCPPVTLKPCARSDGRSRSNSMCMSTTARHLSHIRWWWRSVLGS